MKRNSEWLGLPTWLVRTLIQALVWEYYYTWQPSHRGGAGLSRDLVTRRTSIATSVSLAVLANRSC